ncbi:MAG: 50S ribosomal protein L32 [Synergistetes bacterium]|nr:50S ribosomal protein L32 [Synergistota bacterium]MCX8127194.1 50S ribosomal protein L32 [Synergistota bacterium]MDW8191920.1 50S ribosomal protein L32 [Synergistota bacterium]
MAVPKRKTSKARRDKRLAQWLRSIKTPSLTTCSHCGEIVPTYRVCPECGYYDGREVLVVEEKEEK